MYSVWYGVWYIVVIVYEVEYLFIDGIGYF